MAILEVKNLKVFYPVAKTNPLQQRKYIKAVDDISFNIREGETFGLVGESGCGKTTIAHTVGGLIKPTAGEILINGLEINFKNKEMQRNVQIIFQDPYSSLNPRKTIGWLLTEPLRVYNQGSRMQQKKKVIAMLEEAGFDQADYDKYPHELSGGQRQRIVILCALMLNPKLVIADEPVSSLDVSVQASILNFMNRLQDKYQLTYLFISHDLSVVHHVSDRIGVMYLGKLVEVAKVEDIYQNPLHPYTQALLSAVPSVYYGDVDNNRIILKGDVPHPSDPPQGCPFHPRCHYCMEKCQSGEPPKLTEVKDGHMVACHLHDVITGDGPF